MNPLTIHATNLRTFETLDVELPTGCAVIGGENGAGKSTILNAIDVALFAGRGELPPLLSLGEDELVLELTFEHAGELYRVRRMFSGKGRGKTVLDLERQLVVGNEHRSDVWEPLTRETADATQQHLEQILGLSRATFRASSFLAQGDGAAFTDAQPRDRKAILAEILGLDVYDQLLTKARHELRGVEDGVLVVRGRISTLEEEAAGGEQIQHDLANTRASLTVQLEQQAIAEAMLEQAQQAQAANAAAVERHLRAGAALAAAQADQERARQAYAAAVQAGIDRDSRQHELVALSHQADAIPTLEQRLAAAQERARLVEQREQLRREAETRDLARERLAREANHLRENAAILNGKADHLDAHIGEASSCDRCGQTLGAEAAARAAASYRAEATTALEKATQVSAGNDAEYAAIAELLDEIYALEVRTTVGEDVAQVEPLLTAARAAGERRATLAEQVRQLAEQAAAHDDLALKLAHAGDATTEAETVAAAAREQVGDVAQLDQNVTLARAAVATVEQQLQTLREQVVRLQVAEQRVVTAAAELVAATGQIADAQQTIDVLKLAERAFGRDGIPALILESSAIPTIEVEANRILSDLGTTYRVELRTQRALKTTESLRETLDVLVFDGTDVRAYETFSGGEKTRVNLALRLALASLLAHRRGAESRLLAIDELDGLDAAGMDALVGILNGLSSTFDRIILVSHQPQLASSFEQQIQIVKVDGRSRIVSDRQPVAA